MPTHTPLIRRAIALACTTAGSSSPIEPQNKKAHPEKGLYRFAVRPEVSPLGGAAHHREAGRALRPGQGRQLLGHQKSLFVHGDGCSRPHEALGSDLRVGIVERPGVHRHRRPRALVPDAIQALLDQMPGCRTPSGGVRHRFAKLGPGETFPIGAFRSPDRPPDRRRQALQKNVLGGLRGRARLRRVRRPGGPPGGCVVA